jgi:site-specific DNA recombinase
MPVQAIDPARVAIYIRWSTDDQSEGTTLAVQEERCRHFLLSQGWIYDEGRIYIDEGYSGGNMERPALTRLRADVGREAVQCVVVYKIDRLSRSVVDIVDLVLKEWEGRCFVRSTTEEINTLTPAGKMFFYLLISFAEYERNLIRERTMSGKVKRAEQGFNPGFRPPFGFVRGPTPGTFAVVEDEAAVVREVFAAYVGGAGPAEIARGLGGRAGSGRAWTALAVRRMLGNPAYAGVLAYGRRRTAMLARAEGAFPAIVDRGLWEAAQALRRGRGRDRAAGAGTAETPETTGPPPPRATPYLLSGLAFCPCGAPVVGKGAGRHRYYCCARRRLEGKAGCAARHIPAGEADEALAVQVRTLLTASGVTEQLARALAAQRAGRSAQAVARVRRQLSGLEARRRRLGADYRSGALPAHLYARELAALDSEEQEARSHLEQEPPAPLPIDDLWAHLPTPRRRWLLERLAESIMLERGESGSARLAIRWRTDLPDAVVAIVNQLVGGGDHLS